MTRITKCLDLIDEAISRYSPVAVYALFSGGHDSLTATHIAFKHPKITSAVHINTGIGVERTREFVRTTCKREGWPLKEYKAIGCGQDYRALVKEYGFPGADHHNKMYNRLKERPLRQLIRDTKTKPRDKILFISGCRSQESLRRMGNTQPIQVEGVKVWSAIIHDWSKSECNEYISNNELPRNEVVDLIHKSGECLCGAYAKPGELRELEMWFPDAAHSIHRLEREVWDAGFPWRWEEQPPKWFKESKRGQSFLCEMTSNPMMCQSCEKRQSDRELEDIDEQMRADHEAQKKGHFFAD